MLQDSILIEYIDVLNSLLKAIEDEDSELVESLVKKEKKMFETYGDELLEAEGFLEALTMRKQIIDKLESKVQEIFLRIKKTTNQPFNPNTPQSQSIYLDNTV